MKGFSEISWFVEGLAVYVSGQFTQEKKQELLSYMVTNWKNNRNMACNL